MVHQPQLAVTTAFSDLVLCLSGMWGCLALKRASKDELLPVMYYFYMLITASALGVVRFGMMRPPDLLTRTHSFASSLTASLGTLCLSWQFCYQYGQNTLAWIVLGFNVLFFLAYVLFADKLSIPVGELGSVLNVLTLVGLGVWKKNYKLLGAAGALAYTSLGIGTEGRKFYLPRVDWFHYGLCFVNYLLVQAVTVR